MKYIIVITSLMMFAACNQQADNTQQLQVQIDSLKSKLNNTYKPGFGEFMSSIQVHHNKLWFAGTNNNWKLADFEVHEIQEALEDIQNFNTDRPEAKAIGMINPAIDSVSNAIKKQDQQLFKSSYTLLTNSCNNCHRATEHEFNLVTIPSTPPYSNQSFKPAQ
jgi:chaperonin cofactor prefoldin